MYLIAYFGMFIYIYLCLYICIYIGVFWLAFGSHPISKQAA